MTRAEARAVIRALSQVEPVAPSVELTPEDRAEIREQFALAVADSLGLIQETALIWLDAARMSA